MRQFYGFLILMMFSFQVLSQEKLNSKIDLSGRANDHFMLQLSADNWLETPDSISSHIKGFSRGANISFMLDKPFKSNPKISIAAGVGIGSSHVFFRNMQVDLAGAGQQLPFRSTDSAASFSKYKLATSFLEIPLELRFSSKPAEPNKSLKIAIGIKGGLLLNAHTKGKDLQTPDGEKLINGSEKQSSKQYFNSSRLALTARVGFGVFGLFGSYNLTPMFKSGVASQDIRLLQIGAVISGL